MIPNESMIQSNECIHDNLVKLIFFILKARNKVTEMINKAIVHYREDIDLQNLIDFGQKEVRTKSKTQTSYVLYCLYHQG